MPDTRIRGAHWKRVLFGRSLSRTLFRGILTAAVLVVISRTALTPVRAHGVSMQPAYRDGQLLLVNLLAYRLGEPTRGEVIAIRIGSGQAALIKRVVGLPGERVRIEDGTVLVNDSPLAEPYVRFRASWEVPETRLGTGEYFVIGDNRGMPARLHDFGRAQRSRIMGRLVF